MNTKKGILKRMLSGMVMMCMVLSLMMPVIGEGQTAYAATDIVYLSAEGDDTGDGTSASPYATLNKALEEVSDYGTVQVVGTYALASDFSWTAHGKTVTITGGTLDATAVGDYFYMNDNVTFDALTLTLPEKASLYANGNQLAINETVTLTNTITVYGGGNRKTVANTNIKLLAGTYNYIFGGCWSGTVEGDTNVYLGGTASFSKVYGGGTKGTVSGNTNIYIGGNVNASITEKDHGGTCYVYGGGLSETIGGSTNLTFAEHAKAHQIFGGSGMASGDTTGGTIGESANIYFTGGSVMGIYGGSVGVDSDCDVNVTITGGEVEQVFGASSGAALTGNVNLKILGGKVTRRIYGGCYNEYSSSGLLSYSWKSSYYVVGTVKLIISGDATISFDAVELGTTTSQSDLSIYAHSRQSNLSSTEITSIVFTDATAYTKYKDKLTAQDWEGAWMMDSTSAADSIHYYQYAVDTTGAVLTETCAYCTDHSATATLSVDESVSLVYQGAAIEVAKVTYDAAWESDPFEITYTNNCQIGTATASVTRNGVTASIAFTIREGTIDVFTEEDFAVVGASIRFVDNNTAVDGIRFGVGIRKDVYDELKEGVKDNLRLLLLPTCFVEDGELNVGEQSSSGAQAIDTKLGSLWKQKTYDGVEYMVSYVYLYNIAESGYTLDLTARAYWRADSTDEPVYSEKIERSYVSVANKALNDISTNLDSVYKNVAGSSYSPYTDVQRDALLGVQYVKTGTWDYIDGILVQQTSTNTDCLSDRTVNIQANHYTIETSFKTRTLDEIGSDIFGGFQFAYAPETNSFMELDYYNSDDTIRAAIRGFDGANGNWIHYAGADTGVTLDEDTWYDFRITVKKTDANMKMAVEYKKTDSSEEYQTLITESTVTFAYEADQVPYTAVFGTMTRMYAGRNLSNHMYSPDIRVTIISEDGFKWPNSWSDALGNLQ